MTKQPVDVLVVGAGPVGLTMAAALTHHGLKCRLIDKAAEPTDKSKALVVWSRTLELLDNLDLATTFVQTGMKIDGASIYGSGKRLVHLAISGLNSPFGFPLMIPQNETERLLTEHLVKQGVTVERQVELLSFTEQHDSLVGKLRHPDGQEESFTVPWLIGCDGAHSTVRHTLGMQFTGHAEPNDWMLADVHIDGTISTTEISVFWHEKGVLVFFPITKDRFRVIADLGMAGAERPADPSLAEVQAKVDERGPGGLKLVDPIWLASFRINERKVTDYRKGRVMLAGDAAHIHSPAGGQGMNTGMQDAFNLAWKLALIHRGQGQETPLLDSYSQERSTIGDQVLRAAERVTQMATLRNPVAQFLRNHIACVVSSFGLVQDKIKNALCELSINYRHSALSVEDWPMGRGGEAAGDRLGDAPLLSAQNAKPTTLFRVIHDTRHALLLLPSVNDQDTVAALLKIAKEAEQAYPNVLSTNLIVKTAADLTDHSKGACLARCRRNRASTVGCHREFPRPHSPRWLHWLSMPTTDGKALLQYLGRYLKT
ncbi:MAG: FAD-dependent monooxygenase [Gemmatales bacterium]